MLILSRKLGEKIAIDGDIQLQVLEVSGNRVRLGIVAPDDCRIMRAECLAPEVPLPEPRQTTPSSEARSLPHWKVNACTNHLPIWRGITGSLPVRG